MYSCNLKVTMAKLYNQNPNYINSIQSTSWFYIMIQINSVILVISVIIVIS